jgi:hypothetical protein
MSIWTFPTSLEAFEEEDHTNPANLYQNLQNTLNLANQSDYIIYETDEAVKVDPAEARCLLTEATQRLQEAPAIAPLVPEQVPLGKNLRIGHSPLPNSTLSAAALGARGTLCIMVQVKIIKIHLVPIFPSWGDF